MTNYHAFTPASDTMEMPAAHRGAPVTDLPTAELWFLEGLPEVRRTRYQRRGLLRSPFARHLRQAARSTFLPLLILSVLWLAYYGLTTVQALTPVTAIR